MRSAFRTRFHRPKSDDRPPLESTATDNSAGTVINWVITQDAYATPIETDHAVTVEVQVPVGATIAESLSQTPVTTTDTVTVVLT